MRFPHRLFSITTILLPTESSADKLADTHKACQVASLCETGTSSWLELAERAVAHAKSETNGIAFTEILQSAKQFVKFM